MGMFARMPLKVDKPKTGDEQMEGDRAQCCGYKANISLISDEQGCEPMKHSVQITPLDLHCKDNFGQIGFMMICTNM